MNKKQLDSQMMDYLQREERMVKGWVSDLESLLSTFKDSEKVSNLPNEVTSQALPSIPHWELELEFHNYKLEWLKSQINLFNNN